MRSADSGNAINPSEFGECPVSEHVGMKEVVVGGQKEADRGDSSVDAVDLFLGALCMVAGGSTGASECCVCLRFVSRF